MRHIRPILLIDRTFLCSAAPFGDTVHLYPALILDFNRRTFTPVTAIEPKSGVVTAPGIHPGTILFPSDDQWAARVVYGADTWEGEVVEVKLPYWIVDEVWKIEE